MLATKEENPDLPRPKERHDEHLIPLAHLVKRSFRPQAGSGDLQVHAPSPLLVSLANNQPPINRACLPSLPSKPASPQLALEHRLPSIRLGAGQLLRPRRMEKAENSRIASTSGGSPWSYSSLKTSTALLRSATSVWPGRFFSVKNKNKI